MKCAGSPYPPEQMAHGPWPMAMAMLIPKRNMGVTRLAGGRPQLGDDARAGGRGVGRGGRRPVGASAGAGVAAGGAFGGGALALEHILVFVNITRNRFATKLLIHRFVTELMFWQCQRDRFDTKLMIR